MIDLVQRVMSDSSVHTWVKEQYLASLNRDILDALNDAKLLAAMLQDRWEMVKLNFQIKEGQSHG